MKKIFSLLLIALTVAFAVPTYASDKGMIFYAETTYQTEKVMTQQPVTFEAVVKFPQGYTKRAGTIVGNYGANSARLNFEVHENGVPRIYCQDGLGTTWDFRFDSVNICTGEPVHISVVMDSASSKAYCYIDGELRQTLSGNSYPKLNITSVTALGGDLRDGNGQYFKGELYSLVLYSDMRTASEIASDVTAPTPDTDGLVAAYKLRGSDITPEMIEDISGNGNDFYIKSGWMWIKKEPELEPYAYSFAVVGDTQIVNRDYPHKLTRIYDWILDNADRFNTKFVFGLGDVTDLNTPAEYALGDAMFQRLKGVIPFSIIRGNHDRTAQFNEYFTVEKYGDQISGCFNNKMDNTYHKFDVGNIKYLAINIDCGAADDMLAWANEICAANPDRNVIVTTHAYIGPTGALLSDADGTWDSRWGANDGTQIWDKFIKKHKNIVLVICGHKPNDTIIRSTKKGENGNLVTQLLVDPQHVDVAVDGGVGLVAMLYFSEDGKTVQVRNYSTIKEAYYLEENQFKFTIETVSSGDTAVKAMLDNSSLTVKLTPDKESNLKISFTPENYTFTVDTEENNTLSVDIDTNGVSEGKVISALYDKRMRLRNVKIFDCAPRLNVTFDGVHSGDKLKVCWWDGADTLMPIGNAE